LLLYSEQFDNANWQKTACTVSANASTAPDGTLSADRITANAGTAYHYARQSPNLTGQYIYSVYVKRVNNDFIWLSMPNDGATLNRFNLATGQFTVTGAGVTATSASVGNDWYKLSLSFNGGITHVSIGIGGASGNESFNAAGTEAVDVWGAQLEVGSTPTDYQPITDWNTEFKAAFPTHSLYVDSNGVAPAVYPGDQVGLVIDSGRGGLENLGSELNSAFDMSVAGWTTLGAGTTKTASTFTTTAAGGVSISHGQAANPLVNGRAYYVEMSVSCTVSTTFDFRDGGSTVLIPAVSVGTTPVTLKGIANITNTLGMYLRGNAAGTYTIHSFSIKQIPGNPVYQTTSGSRPALARTPDGGRRNLLTYSEQFDDAAWTKANVTVTANNSADPIGTTTADRIVETAATGEHRVQNTAVLSVTAGTVYTASVYAKAGEVTILRIGFDDQAKLPARVFFNLSNGTVSFTEAGAGAITSVGNGWYRCTITGTCGTSHSSRIELNLVQTGTTASYAGNTSNGLLLWGAQYETGSSATAYQKVGLTSDVTESGKRDCWGLLFDGSDDSLQTASVDFSATDKMTVMAGVRKLSDAARGMLGELGNGLSTGYFQVNAPTAALGNYGINASGSSTVFSFATFAKTAPTTDVVTATFDIAGDSTVLRTNATQRSSDTTDCGSGNFSNAILYIGSRGGSSLRLNGIIYTLIVRGATTPTGTIADFEKNLLRMRAGLGPF
jgi:hypothetical protein